MVKLMKQLLHEKKTYKEHMRRADALPEDYRFVFHKIHDYMWGFASDHASTMIEAQKDLLELFEQSALDGKHVLEVTGEDVASFCDEFLRDTRKWTDRYSNRLNKAMKNKLHPNG